jgi:hypothetical protein
MVNLEENLDCWVVVVDKDVGTIRDWNCQERHKVEVDMVTNFVLGWRVTDSWTIGQE